MKRVALAVAIVLAPRVADAAVCVGRPTDSGGYAGYTYGTDPVKTYDTTQIRVHYATSGANAPKQASTRSDGVPDVVALAGDTAEEAVTKYAQMGYRAIPSDATCASNGGDARVDVYLVTFSGADGTTVPEACDGAACSSFVLSQANFGFGSGYANDTEAFRTVLSHELFHAVQNAYDSQLARFWAEGSAQWAMKTLHPELQDFERQLPAFFSDPHHSIDTPPSGVTNGYLYGAAVLPLFLQLTRGEDFVKLVLEAEADGTAAIPAIDKVLQTKGSSFADAFPMFWAWNAATKGYAGGGGYPEAATYPGVKADALSDGATAINSGYGAFVYAGTLDGATKVSLETDASRNAGVLVPVESGVAKLDQAQKLPATAQGDALVVVAGVSSKKQDAPFTIRYGAPDAPDAGASSSGGGGGGGGCRTARGEGGALAFAIAALLVPLARRLRRRG